MAHDGWVGEAMSQVLLVEAVLVLGWVFMALVRDAQSGFVGFALYAYLLLMGAVVAALVTFLVVLPLGFAWVRILRSVAGARGTQPGV